MRLLAENAGRNTAENASYDCFLLSSYASVQMDCYVAQFGVIACLLGTFVRLA